MKRTRVVMFFAAIGLWGASQAQANLIITTPDLTVADVATDYDPGTNNGSLLIFGTATFFNPGGGALNVTALADVIITATGLNPGGAPTAGMLYFTPFVPALAAPPLEVTGTLTGFNYQTGGDLFELLFTVDVSNNAYYLVGSTIGVVLDSNLGGSFVDWSTAFDGSHGTADLGAPVPEPGTALLLTLGLGAIGACKRRLCR